MRWPGKQAIGIIDGLSDGAIRAHLRAAEKHYIQLRRLVAADGGEPTVAIKAGGIPLDPLRDGRIRRQNRPAYRLECRLQWMRHLGNVRSHPGAIVVLPTGRRRSRTPLRAALICFFGHGGA